MFLFKNKLLRLLLLGFLIRLVLMPIDYSWDVRAFMAWGKEAYKYGLSGFYDRPTIERYGINMYPPYPPLPILFFYLVQPVFQIINMLMWQLNTAIPAFPSKLVFIFQSPDFLAVLVKFLPVFSDCALAGVIYMFIKKLFIAHKKKELLARIGAAFILFNPAFFYTSGLWGQIDSLPIVFVLSSLYVLFFTHKKYTPWVFYAIALLAKQTAIVALPVFIIAYFKKNGFISSLQGAIVGLAVFFIGFLPFYQQGNIFLFPFRTYGQKILTGSGLMLASNHAFNFWALVTQWTDIPDTVSFIFGISYQWWGYILTSFFLGIILIQFNRKKLEVYNTLFASAMSVFIVFSFMTRIHERHFQPVLILLVPFVAINRNYRKIIIVLSIFHTVNLYHNWAVPDIVLLVNAIRSPAVVNSMIIIGLVIFFVLFKKYLTEPDRIRHQTTGDIW